MPYGDGISSIQRTFLSLKIHVLSWLILRFKQARITISDEEKALLVQGIIDSALKLMERIITDKSAKNRAISWSKSHKQSRIAITSDTILFNVFANVQQLPARPRDFRINLSEDEDEKKIGDPELSDVLTSMVFDFCVLENNRDRFPFLKGRRKSYLAEENRGRNSYYEPSIIKEVIDEVLRDPEAIKTIDDALIGAEITYKFLKYSFEAGLYQSKENEKAFLNTYKPAIMKYGQAYKTKEELNESWLYVKHTSREKLKSLAKAHAHNLIQQFKGDGKNVLYVVAGLIIYLNKAYESR